MKKKTKSTRTKLSLNKSTIRFLGHRELARVAGADGEENVQYIFSKGPSCEGNA